MIIQNTKKQGKKIVKVGKPVLEYKITFSTPMNTTTLGNPANYVMDTVVTVKKTKKKPATNKDHAGRVRGVIALTSDSVTLKPAGSPFATKAGQIVVNASSGVACCRGRIPGPPVGHTFHCQGRQVDQLIRRQTGIVTGTLSSPGAMPKVL